MKTMAPSLAPPPAPQRGASLLEWNKAQNQASKEVNIPTLLREIHSAITTRDQELGLVQFCKALSNEITRSDLRRILGSSFDFCLSDVQARALWNSFAGSHKDDKIPAHDLVSALCGPMTQARVSVSHYIFDALKDSVEDSVYKTKLIRSYDANAHPDVGGGKVEASAVHSKLMQSLGGFVPGSKMLNSRQWQRFCQFQSSLISDDTVFCNTMKQTWLREAPTFSPPSVPVVQQSQKQNVRKYSSIKDPPACGTLLQALKYSNRVEEAEQHVRNSPTKGKSVGAAGISSKNSTVRSTKQCRLNTNGSSNITACFQQESSPTRGKQQSPNKRTMLASNVVEPPYGIQCLLNNLKASLKRRGVEGLFALSRNFQSMDSNKDGSLSFAEFARAMRSAKLNVTEGDLGLLFRFFDSNQNGTIQCSEFLQGVGEPMTARREALVIRAFEMLDTENAGKVDPQVIVQTYDASQHPDVLSSKKSEDAVFREFLQSFQVDTASTNGKVTYDAWQQYYRNISSTITDEDYFERMMRNTWHIEGEVIPYGSVPDRKYCVTHHDGRETVEVVPREVGEDQEEVLYYLQTSLEIFAKKIVEKVDDSVAVQSLKHRNISSGAASCLSFGAATDYSTGKRINSNAVAVGASVGLQLVINQMKSAIQARGVHGFIGLARTFRLMDEDRSNSLTLAEFKHALRDYFGTNTAKLSDKEIYQLFNHFDTDHSGTIDLTEFLSGIRDPMNDRRLALAHAAFNLMDKDGNGLLELSDIVEAYDASKHPEVIAGKKTPEQVFHEFLDHFDVDHLHTGSITVTEWEHYYNNISSSIDDDDYFELMMRNAWHISGGTGWCGNTANRRVLVTHNDGRETVEEIKNDLQLKHSDKHALLRHIHQQGIVTAKAITFADNDDATARRKEQQSVAGYRSCTVSSGAAACLSYEEPEDKLGYSRGTKKKTNCLVPSAGIQSVLNRLKEDLRRRGAVGIISIGRSFRAMDEDRSGSLTMGEFSRALREHSALKLLDSEMRLLFSHFDSDSSGTIDFNEFLGGIRDPMNERRLALVRHAFTLLDKDGNGLLETQDIVQTYDASKHPEVLEGKKTPDQVFREFLDNFDVDHLHTGKITPLEWEHYYHNISSCIDDDDYFELMMRNAWHISGGSSWCANSVNRRVLVTHEDGRNTVEEIANDLGHHGNDEASIKRHLRLQGIRAKRVKLHDVTDEVTAKAAVAATEARNASRGASSCLYYEEENDDTSMEDGTELSSKQRKLRKVLSSKPRSANAGLIAIMNRLKQTLKQRGAHGIIGLGRCFRVMDTDGSGTLTLAEFRAAMAKSNVPLSDTDTRLLFTHFDSDHSGTIDFTEFLIGVRDPMNDRRLALVNSAFKEMDKDGNGLLEVSDIVKAYDASQHPEVLSGKKTTDQVFKEFLETFDVDHLHTGSITPEEWEHYYNNVSSSIDDDDYFELMMRNAWHISGGSGWCANTSNRRVLVTHHDGHQTVEEIKNDLGTNKALKEDSSVLHHKLRLQGIYAKEVRLYEALDKTTPTAKEKARQANASKSVQDALLHSTSPLDVSFTEASVPVPKLPEHAKLAVQYIRQALQVKGIQAFARLHRALLESVNDQAWVSRLDFTMALESDGIILDQNAIQTVFSALKTTNAAGHVSVSELMALLCGPISASTQRLIRQTYEQLLRNVSSSSLTPFELAEQYDAANHPAVRFGQRTAEEVYEEFLASFDVDHIDEAVISWHEFQQYCSSLKACTPDETYFCTLIQSVFHP